MIQNSMFYLSGFSALILLGHFGCFKVLIWFGFTLDMIGLSRCEYSKLTQTGDKTLLWHTLVHLDFFLRERKCLQVYKLINWFRPEQTNNRCGNTLRL